MIQFIGKRMLSLIPALLGVSLAVFILLRTTSGDPALHILRLSGIPPTKEALEHTRTELGLGRPHAEQFLNWFANAAHLDFGRSFITKKDVLEQILLLLPNTLILGAAALLLAFTLGIPAGTLCAAFHGKWPDTLGRTFACAGVCAPAFWLGYGLMLLFSIRLGWLPATGTGDWKHLVMPVAVTAAAPACLTARLVRNAMLERLDARPALHARLRGVTEGRILLHHVLRPSLAPVAAAAGMFAGEILGGAVVAETVFARPGIGRLALSALLNRDFPVTQCLVPALTLVFALCTLGADILHALADPRVLVAEETAEGARNA